MVPASHDEMWFVGVDTAASRAVRLFDAWAKILGVHLRLRGIDIPPGDPDNRLPRIFESVRAGDAAGVLVTTHKATVARTARAQFDRLTDDAALLHDVGAVYWEGNLLVGDASDVRSSRRALSRIAGHRSGTPGTALILGGGGAGASIALTISRHFGDVWRDVRVVEANPIRVRELAGLERAASIHVEQADGHLDRLVEGLGPGALIVNATGLGKDLPGNPVSGAVAFPPDCQVWELNYRGSLDFMKVAQAADPTTVFDGEEYFYAGWLEVMSLVAGVSATDELFDAFKEAGSAAR